MGQPNARELNRRVEEGEMADGAAYHLLWERIDEVLVLLENMSVVLNHPAAVRLAYKIVRLLNGEEEP